MNRMLALLPLALVFACGSEEPDQSWEREVLSDPAMDDGCTGWCEQQLSCGATTLSLDDCRYACAADVGTPGADCAEALDALAECLEQSCDETACNEALGRRSEVCGGRG